MRKNSRNKVAWFDAEALFETVDGVRAALGWNWKQVGEATGVSASTFTRVAQGNSMDLDTMASLATWVGLSAGRFVRVNLEFKGTEGEEK